MAFRMIDVGDKPVTRRTARARGEIQLSDHVFTAITEQRVPKGDVLALAEVAAIMAVKKTPDILPLCHQLVIDAVRVVFEMNPESARIAAVVEVTSHGKTGVEMEALHGVTAALLCIYDLTKALEKGSKILSVELLSKSGGRSGEWKRGEEDTPSTGSLSGFRAAVLVASDSRSAGMRQDTTGPVLAQFLKEEGAAVEEYSVVPDERAEIENTVQRLASARPPVHLLILTGGTGIGPRDSTPEALSALWTKRLPGFGELFRNTGLLSTPAAWLSRAEAGVVGSTVVVLLPGSPGGVRDGISILRRHARHLLEMIQGGGHDD